MTQTVTKQKLEYTNEPIASQKVRISNPKNRAEATAFASVEQFTIQMESLESVRDVSFGTMAPDNRSGRMQEVITMLELFQMRFFTYSISLPDIDESIRRVGADAQTRSLNRV
jgi:hypothetical protein